MLAAAGIGSSRSTLGPKEGLTLINGTQAHTAVAALAIVDAHRLWQTAHVAGAMSLEALLGTPVAFDARIHDARGQLGQAAIAALLRELLADSEIRESHRHGDPRVQDPYALRCMPQVHGPVLDAIDFARGDRERASSTRRPTIRSSSRDGELLSGGNFHGQPVAHRARRARDRAHESRDDRPSGASIGSCIPTSIRDCRPSSRRDAGVNSGFMMAQVTAAALASECKVLSHPASVDTIPTDGNKEDVVPMAMGAAWKLRRDRARTCGTCSPSS